MRTHIKHFLLSILLYLFVIYSASAHNEARLKDLPEAARQAMQLESYDNFSLEYGIDNRIRLMLGKDYAAFKRNFEVAGRRYTLKDGGVFLSGWRDGLSLYHAAAIVVYPDGRLYLSFYDKENNVINYYGPKAEEIHKAIKVWSSFFGPTFHLHQIDESIKKNKSDEQSSLEMPAMGDEDLSPIDYIHFKKLAASIWSPIILKNLNFNLAVTHVIATAEEEIYRCSKAMGYVPSIDFVPPYSLRLESFFLL